MVWGLIAIIGVLILLVYMVGHSINIVQATVDGQRAFKRSKKKCPYCGKIGHGKEYHVPKG
jgi:hypothetical protein